MFHVKHYWGGNFMKKVLKSECSTWNIRLAVPSNPGLVTKLAR